MHRETSTQHTSSTKTREKVGELEDEPFRKVEEALKVSEGPQTLMLGNNKVAKARNGLGAQGTGSSRRKRRRRSSLRKASCTRRRCKPSKRQ